MELGAPPLPALPLSFYMYPELINVNSKEVKIQSPRFTFGDADCRSAAASVNAHFKSFLSDSDVWVFATPCC